MIRGLLWLLTLAGLAVGLSLAARYNEGYVLIVMPPWRAELSLNVFLFAAAVGFLFAYSLSRGVGHLVSIPTKAKAFRLRRRREAAEAALYDAWRLIQEGRYGHAMRSAEKAWVDHPFPGLVALAGWRAANELRDAQRAAPWAERVRQSESDSLRIARLMMEAELALGERRFEDARNALQQVARLGGRHIAALRLSLRTEQGLGNWPEVARLARQLQKYKALTAEQAEPVRRRAQRESIRMLADDSLQLKRVWHELAAQDRHDPVLALEAARAFVACGQFIEAQRVIEATLDAHWDRDLVLVYADTENSHDRTMKAGSDVIERIAKAEKWLLTHPRDSALLLTLGRLCLCQKLWGKGRSYLEASLAIEPSRAAHLELAQLLDSFDDTRLENAARANQHYRAAAVLP